jgi:hypothetical protein
MIPSSQQAPEGGCWERFLAVGGTEGGPTGPRPGARHTFQHGWSPSSGTEGEGGHCCSPPGTMRVHKQSVPSSEEKTVLSLESSWAVPIEAL